MSHYYAALTNSIIEGNCGHGKLGQREVGSGKLGQGDLVQGLVNGGWVRVKGELGQTAPETPASYPSFEKDCSHDDDYSDDDDSSYDDGPFETTINDVESLRQGILKTQKTGKTEYTILVVGETGVGKSSVIEFLANVLAGNPIREYNYEIIDKGNEEGGSEMHSQTNDPRLYTFRSVNGHIVRILDTPGLADTRGIGQDEKRKQSIANVIAQNIATITAVIVLANGTVPRITVGTDYALSTLSAIFPRSLTDNILFMFTNVPNPLAWNFADDSIPPMLSHVPKLWLNNPLSLQKVYLRQRNHVHVNRQLRRQMRSSVDAAENNALNTLVRLFDWLDGRISQPTKDIMSLYQHSQFIEDQISAIRLEMDKHADKKNEIRKLSLEIEKAESNIHIFKNYKSIANRQQWVQENTQSHNTLCSVSDCYSNCHVECEVGFSLNPYFLGSCKVMRGGGRCTHCGHHSSQHRHYHARWRRENIQERIVDKQMERKFLDATNEKKEKKELMKIMEDTVAGLEDHIETFLLNWLAELLDDYSRLSLSGSFSSQVEKAVVMLEQHYESLKGKGVDQGTLNEALEKLETMKRKVEVLRRSPTKRRF